MEVGVFGQLDFVENRREKTHFMDTIGPVVSDVRSDACTVTQTGNSTGGRVVQAVDAVDEETNRLLDLMLMTHEGIADDGLPQFLMTRSLFDHPPVTIGHDEDHGFA